MNIILVFSMGFAVGLTVAVISASIQGPAMAARLPGGSMGGGLASGVGVCQFVVPHLSPTLPYALLAAAGGLLGWCVYVVAYRRTSKGRP